MKTRIPEAVLKRPLIVVLAVLLITCFMFYGLTKISMTTEFKEFLPKDSPAVLTTEEFENKFGSATELILLRAENVLRADVFLTILDLESTIMGSGELENYATGVVSYAKIIAEGIPNYKQIPESLLENMILGAFAGPYSSELRSFVNENQTATLITVSTSPGMSRDERNRKTDAFVRIVREFDENRDDVELEVTGDLVIGREIYGLMDRDNSVLIPAAIVFVLLVLLLTFKRASEIGFSLAVVGCSALWAVGMMGLTGLKFTMIHVALIPLIFGLGIDYSIHMLNRYHEELRNQGVPLKAAVSSMRTTGGAVVLAAVTTIVGFGSFMVSDLPAIGTLGVFAALGIGFSFFLSTCFLPSLLVIRGEKRAGRKAMERGRMIDRALGKAASLSESHGKFIVGAALLVTVICAVMASDVRTEMSFKTFLPSDVPSMIALEHVSEEFGGQYVMMALAHGDYMDPNALQEILNVQNAAVEGNEIITGSSSLASAVREITVRMYGGIPLENLSREQIAEIVSSIDERELARFVRENTAVVYFYVNAKTDKDMASASRTVREAIENIGGRYIDMNVDGKPAVGGLPVIIGDISESISGGMMRTTILAILLCLIVVAVAFRSIVLGGITLVPLLLTTAWEFGALKAMGWSMDILTMGISSLVIGVGIDYGIHMIHRFLEESKKGEMGTEVHTAVTHVGRALVAAAGTTIGVFGILAMSRMPAVMRFGTLTALLILFAFISAILILPSIVTLWAKTRKKRKLLKLG